MTTHTAQYKAARNAAFRNMREMGMGVRGSMAEAIAYASSQTFAAPTAASVAASLRVASRAKQQLGATEKQIEYLVSLAEKAGRLDKLTNVTTLTKREASAMIDNLL